ncbi:phage tail protein [Alteribacter populi]|uniref:phage tail protein n=1 Tax=Alteribacter populi TaxID=2011011 RepID=UPI000BBAD69E|nr:phage tail protein [Alteribacter populi]
MQKGGITLLTITDLNGDIENLTNIKGFTLNRKVNGDRSIAFSCIPDESNEHAFGMIDGESSIEYSNARYVIKRVNEGNSGHKSVKHAVAIHEFFDTMRRRPERRILNGNQSFSAILAFIFEGTPYTFNIVDSYSSERVEDFGNTSKLTLFKQALEIYGSEFTVLGNLVTLRREIGANVGFQFRYGYNVNAINVYRDTDDLAAVIRGYGGEPDEDGVYPVEVTYVSPHVDIIGEENEAPPVYNRDITNESEMLDLLEATIIDEPQLSITIDIADLRADNQFYEVVNEGDRGYIVYEPMGLTIEARVVEISETFDANLKPISTKVTLSNIRESIIDDFTRFSNTSTQVNRIMGGQAKLPFNVLDDAVLNATRALQSAQTELVFENGILAIEKENPNEVVIFNSKGIGISKDGGQTVTTAMTGDGMVADVITGGQINANNVTIYGGDTENYTRISGADIESRGSFTRTWFGETKTHDVAFQFRNGRMRVENFNEDKRLYFSDFGISTFLRGYDDESDNAEFHGSGVIEFFSHMYNPDVRGLTLFSNRGTIGLRTMTRDIILDSDRNVEIMASRGTITLMPRDDSRSGNNHFRFNVKDNDGPSDTDGWIQYGSPNTNYGSGLRFQKTSVGEPMLWVTNGNGDKGSGSLWANKLFGALEAKVSSAYVHVDHRLRVTSMSGYNGDSTSYRPIEASGIMTGHTNLYLGVSGTDNGEVRVTNKLLRNDGDTTYYPIRASEYRNGSSLQYKTNIEPLEDDGRYVINKLEVVKYFLQQDVDNGVYDNEQVGLISEFSPEVATKDQKAIIIYKLLGYAVKAIQEQDDIILDLKDRIEILEGSEDEPDTTGQSEDN